MFFNKSKLSEHHEKLSLTDLETVIDQSDIGYSATCIFADKEGLCLEIFSESENAKKISISKRDSSKNYEEEGSEHQVDRPHPIMKVTTWVHPHHKFY